MSELILQLEQLPLHKKRYGFFEEDGCHVWKHCLSCPLPTCIYDDPHVIMKMRDEVIRKLNDRGTTITSIAQQLLVSEKTVKRALKRNEDGRSSFN
mgnify:CR=1 FL=1